MEEKQFNNDRMNRKLEQIVLVIFTVFSLSMLVSSFLLKWNIIAKEIIAFTVVAGWFVSIKRYRNYNFRAQFLSLMVWINFCICAFASRSFTSMLSMMLAVIVLMGVFCISEVIYIGVFFTTVLMAYHVFVAQTFIIATANDVIRLVLHVVSVYIISFVTWLGIRTRQEANEKLLENIRRLENVEKSKDDFMVNISHEIRTPINAVCGMSEAILQEELPTDVRRDVIDIQTAGRNLLATVSNILDFSELESGKMTLAEESYNITSTITDIINIALTMENGKQLELIVDCDADLPSNLLGDEQKLRRIVLNLMENAIKFTREGGIVLRVKSRKEEYGINLLVTISDSGIGMTQEELEKIFNNFGQLNSGRNREEGGIGLGLAITQALVQNMGGFITVESEAGNGTEFRLTIPQKVLDETPIVSIRNKSSIFAACYINMDKYDYSVVREGYEKCMRHMAEQFGIMFRVCRNFPELKRRMEHENYSHIFIGWEEYCEDKNFFEKLAKELTVVIILDYGQETQVGSNMLRIYKPFTVLSIAAVFNGQRVIQMEEVHGDSRYRFIAPEARILVVDDNAMNLKVMARLLLPYRIKVVMAISGQEALEKLNTMDYDCVYLDHMMPEMDGVETLHKIRQKPGAYFQSLPIIAFTANAIGGAREMFIEEGFDDFIAKPIELSVLERMLRRYIPVQKQIPVEDEMPENVPGNTDAGTPAATAETGSVQAQAAETGTDNMSGAADAPDAGSETKALEDLQAAGINIKTGLAYCGDKDGLREIIEMYHAQGEGRSGKLQRFYEDQDWNNYVILVHALKSNSKGIGAEELSDLAYRLEMAGKEQRIEYILEHHNELMEKHEALLHALAVNRFVYPDGHPEQGSEDNGAAQTDGQTAVETIQEAQQETDIQLLKQQMDILREKLDSFESENLRDILERLAQCTYRDVDLREMTRQIGELVDDFDFLGASGVLDTWEEKIMDYAG